MGKNNTKEIITRQNIKTGINLMERLEEDKKIGNSYRANVHGPENKTDKNLKRHRKDETKEDHMSSSLFVENL